MRRGVGASRGVGVVLLFAALVAPLGTSPGAQETRRGFVWTIERGETRGWLMGSVHMLTAEAYPLPPAMERAFADAQVLVEEADPEELRTPAAATELARRAFLPAGQTLEGTVSGETFRTISERAAKLGLPAQAVARMRPWMAAVTLAALEIQQGGFDPALGVDKHFRDKAAASGKPVQNLETAMEQVAMLEALGPSLQDALVRETLGQSQTALTETRALTAAWQAGDAARLEALLVDGMKDSPEIYKALLLDRNARWVPKIEACLATGRCLVVVGAAHLVGGGGLIDVLRQRGYRVEQP
jgi:hypothetical protein